MVAEDFRFQFRERSLDSQYFRITLSGLARSKGSKLKMGRPRGKVGRPATGETPMIALRLPADLRREIERIAGRRGVSVSQVLREAIEKFVQRERRSLH